LTLKKANIIFVILLICNMYKVLADKIKIPCLGNKKIYLEVFKGSIVQPQDPSFQKEFDILVENGNIEKIQTISQAEKVEKPKIEKEIKTVN
jgi:hypothetical protein